MEKVPPLRGELTKIPSLGRYRHYLKWLGCGIQYSQGGKRPTSPNLTKPGMGWWPSQNSTAGEEGSICNEASWMLSQALGPHLSFCPHSFTSPESWSSADGNTELLHSGALASFSKALLVLRRQVLVSQGNTVGNMFFLLVCVELSSPRGKLWWAQHFGNYLWSHITVSYATLLYLCFEKFFPGCKNNVSSFKKYTLPPTGWRDGLFHEWGTESDP